MIKPNVFIVDDHPVFRRGLAALIERSERFHICGEAENGAQALQKLAITSPDVLLLDIEMPELDGPGLLRILKQQTDRLKVIVVSQSSEDHRLKELIEIGLEGHILKSDEPTEILQAIDSVMQGRRYFSSQLAERFFDLLQSHGAQKQSNKQSSSANIPKISPRERQIAQFVADGMTNRAIAEVLNCSEHTVKCHKANLMRKIGAHNSAEVVAWSTKVGLI